MLSAFVHAGLVTGIIYGLPQDSATELNEIPIEPIFFEILEESFVDSHSEENISEGSGPTFEGSVPTPEGSVPTTITTAFEGPVPTFEGSVPMLEAMPLSVSVAEPPSIELEACLMEEKGPVPLPLPSALQERSRVVSEPRALNRIVPVYPRSARRRGREGSVVVEISVSGSGEVSAVEVVSGSGCKELDAAAVSAVRTARFAPATEDGVRVHGRLRLTFEFKLR